MILSSIAVLARPVLPTVWAGLNVLQKKTCFAARVLRFAFFPPSISQIRDQFPKLTLSEEAEEKLVEFEEIGTLCPTPLPIQHDACAGIVSPETLYTNFSLQNSQGNSLACSYCRKAFKDLTIDKISLLLLNLITSEQAVNVGPIVEHNADENETSRIENGELHLKEGIKEAIQTLDLADKQTVTDYIAATKTYLESFHSVELLYAEQLKKYARTAMQMAVVSIIIFTVGIHIGLVPITNTFFSLLACMDVLDFAFIALLIKKNLPSALPSQRVGGLFCLCLLLAPPINPIGI